MKVSTKRLRDLLRTLSQVSSQKLCWSTLLCFGAISCLNLPIIAQDSGCFFLDSNGEPMDLGHLCGASNNANTSSPKTKLSGSSEDQDLIIIPIKRRTGGLHGTPVVDVTFNGEHTFEMLFDTGATMTVISESMAETIGVEVIGELPFQTASSQQVFFAIATVDETSVSNLNRSNFNIAIAPNLGMGLLGQDLYGTYDITIKYGTIELRRR